MDKLEFVKKLYNGKNCYSDHMSAPELELLHISSKVEDIIVEMLDKSKIVFLTGNPGDGKTYIIKSISEYLKSNGIYTQTDLNNVKDYTEIVNDIIALYVSGKSAVLAVNEYPFLQLCRQLRKTSPMIYDEIQGVKKKIISYDISYQLSERIAIIDLNERNLLATDYDLLSDLLDKIVVLLADAAKANKSLDYNLTALSAPYVREQVLAVFELAAAECEHFAVRDILGALAYIFTACTNEDDEGELYYEAMFKGTNELLEIVQQFDPTYLTVPGLDEALWNGEIEDGWIFTKPENAPKDIPDVEEALDLFKSIKRKFYFENTSSKCLNKLQPDEIRNSTNYFRNFNSQKKKIKEQIIKSINRLFLPSSDDKKQLNIWTTHKYDMSMESAVAISSKKIDSSDLEILMPRPADWLSGMEYMPNHIVLKPKESDTPRLILDIDYLRTLNAIDEGYPIGLLAPQYEQSAAIFLQQLDDAGLTESHDDGEIIIASRGQSYKKIIRIENGKYDFGEDEF